MVGSTAATCLTLLTLVAALGCSASPLVEPKYCLPGTDGKPECVSAGLTTELATSVRALCWPTDYSCMNRRALALTNAIRGRYGKRPLGDGTVSMLYNAIDHCKGLVYSFSHSSLSSLTSKIQCKIFCSAENIAMFSAHSDDPAKVCVDMWEKSSGHLANILGDHHVATIGVYKAANGAWYCTQLFGLRGSGEGKPSGKYCSKA